MNSPAKINVGLHVLGKRPDGFHELETIFQELDWFDTLEFYPAASWQLEIRGDPGLSAGPENLICRAAQALANAAGVPCCARVVLDKQIPSGGGLGGGSSNAAITLIGLSKLWRTTLSHSELHTIASDLGSDCAFFLYGGRAIGRGRGELIEPLEGCFAGNFLVATPPVHISTAMVYGNTQFRLTHNGKNVILQSRITPIPTSENWFQIIFNDLENIVLERHPEIRELRHQIMDAGAEAVLLSGSGSSVFGFFQNDDRAKRAALLLGSQTRVRLCRAVARPRP